MKKITVLAASVVLCLPAFAGLFDSRDKWTQEERTAYCSFFNAQTYYNRAMAVVNAIPDGRFFTPSEKAAILENYIKSHDEAAMVSPLALRAMHPNMQERYERLFISGLTARIASLTYAPTAQNISNGYKLLLEFSKWFNENATSIKVPKGIRATCTAI